MTMSERTMAVSSEVRLSVIFRVKLWSILMRVRG